MIIEHLVIHFGLLVISLIGVVECLLVLRIALLDLQALTAQGLNGPRRLGVQGRVTQSAFLFAAFVVLLTIGARVALADDEELLPPIVLTLIVSFDAVALVLMLKEIMIRRTRSRLDRYADSESVGSGYTHSRRTDR